MDKFIRSFPDARFNYCREATVQEGSVTLSDCFVTGKHTGEAYGYGPFEPVAAKGIVVKHPPYSIRVYFEGDKIKRVEAKSNEGLVGPAFFYHTIGGLVI